MRLRILAVCLFLIVGAVAQPKVQITTTSPGKGPPAKVGDTVVIAYEVRLANGKFVEATDETPYKVTIGAPDVIPGLSEGLVGIRREELRTIEIPPELAYGATGAPPTIPPNSTLVFKVETIYRSAHSHGHDEQSGDSKGHDEQSGDSHGHGEMGEDGAQGRPDAASLDRPAISEFMIRDFYTRPWQYKDSPKKIWRYNAVISGLALSLLVLGVFYEKRSSR